ncbi:Uncharacterized protein TCM_046016 [Theobroma cacao]|uniref:Uncharacterized protein n=1 Tax=Theobroma cacao TaxID=3641 RepID=S1SID9_THECC|nr:Uncharacterized protein TCM_046016 [Theobroma cacao]
MWRSLMKLWNWTWDHASYYFVEGELAALEVKLTNRERDEVKFRKEGSATSDISTKLSVRAIEIVVSKVESLESLKVEEAAVFKKRAIKFVEIEVESLESLKVEESTVIMESAIKAAGTEVNANDMTSHHVATDSIPRTAIRAFIPRICPWVIITIIIQRNGVFEFE